MAKARSRVHRLRRSGRLREMREEAGLSQRDVARAIGVSQPCVHFWESPDGYTPTAAHAARC